MVSLPLYGYLHLLLFITFSYFHFAQFMNMYVEALFTFLDTHNCTVIIKINFKQLINGITLSFKTQLKFNECVHTSQIHAEFEIANTR